MRQPLIDGDILLYEIGFAGEAGWQGDGLPSFDYVAELLHMRINNVCGIIDADTKPIIFFTGTSNFRNAIARRQSYKERPGNKPWHYYNLKAYIQAVYNTRTVDGLEADDLMAIEQSSRPTETIICTRDKDLRQVPGWHYGWELGNQPSFGPLLVSNPGLISLSEDRKKISGYGDLFFYSQCLTGDRVDTIPGLGGCGPVKAFDILFGCGSSQEAFKRVLEAYRAVYGDSAGQELLEQGRLLYMTRELNKDGSPKLWEFPVVEG